MSRTFASLRHHNFRLWFTGNVIASTGSWMQRIAQDWLVLTILTRNDAFQVGVVTALQFLPLLLLSPWAGVVADRYDRRRILQATQIVTALLGLVLGVLVLTGTARIWHVHVLALVGGVASALDSPARQAFVGELVPAADLPNAVGLNSTAFNSARLLGPAIAGLVIDWVGPGWVFVVNAALFLAPVVTLGIMRAGELQPRRVVPRRKGQIREGVVYVRHRPDIIMILVLVTVVSGLGLNFQLTSAIMATEVFDKAAGEYGILGSFMAVGALAGSLLAARRETPRLRMIVVAAAGFGAVEILLGLAPSYGFFALLAIPAGLAALTMITAANATIQVTTDEGIRGRVMALYTMIFLGSTPVGSPLIGWVGEVFGARWSILVGGIASLATALAVGLWGRRYFDIDVRFRRGLVPLAFIGSVERARERAELEAQQAEVERRAQEGN